MSQMMQQQQMAALDQNHAYIASRANAVDAVQGTIAELGNIFQVRSLTLPPNPNPNPDPDPDPNPDPNPSPNPNPNP